MKIDKNEVHIWSTSLTRTSTELTAAYASLSQVEVYRAEHFKFPIHRDRFTAAHGWLRDTLSLYLNIAPAAISFLYSEHKKPFLPPSNSPALQFNLSHSADMAVCAITLNQSVGIDIELMETESKLDLAERFFSTEEYNTLIQSPESKRTSIFYTIWARKEAILKATGKGLSIPLDQFTVPLQEKMTQIELEKQSWSLLPIHIHPEYQSALAASGAVKKISYFEWLNNQPKLIKEEII